MPHKFYHGRTGRVWNVTKRAVGVEVNKQVGNRIIRKRIHVRIEHVQQSRCHEEVMLRIKKNDQLKADAKAQGKIISTKRQPEGPKPGFMVEATVGSCSSRAHIVMKAISAAMVILVALALAFASAVSTLLPEHQCVKNLQSTTTCDAYRCEQRCSTMAYGHGMCSGTNCICTYFCPQPPK
ncbi:60S ribosomal protein L21-2-like [Salvia splendens]|uniref:60S ribosomal protein L21-2-like n=1 Tax=Salvia splendens TaxID=180675 RepID=UPI001C262E29|nr:60S ribosomal protein L21-2-like [Salvia splendens]